MNDAQSRLPELVDSLANEGEIIITRNNKPVARLLASDENSIRSGSLRDLKPSSIGSVLQPFSADDDLLEELGQ